MLRVLGRRDGQASSFRFSSSLSRGSRSERGSEKEKKKSGASGRSRASDFTRLGGASFSLSTASSRVFSFFSLSSPPHHQALQSDPASSALLRKRERKGKRGKESIFRHQQNERRQHRRQRDDLDLNLLRPNPGRQQRRRRRGRLQLLPRRLQRPSRPPRPHPLRGPFSRGPGGGLRGADEPGQLGRLPGRRRLLLAEDSSR